MNYKLVNKKRGEVSWKKKLLKKNLNSNQAPPENNPCKKLLLCSKKYFPLHIQKKIPEKTLQLPQKNKKMAMKKKKKIIQKMKFLSKNLKFPNPLNYPKNSLKISYKINNIPKITTKINIITIIIIAI